MKVALAIAKSLLLLLGLTAAVAASGLRGAAHTDEEQSRRKLPEGQPNYGLTPSEHMEIYGYVDRAGMYDMGYYDGGDYERFEWGSPWGNSNYYRERGGSASGGRGGYGNYGYASGSGGGYGYAYGPNRGGAYAYGPNRGGAYAYGPQQESYYYGGYGPHMAGSYYGRGGYYGGYRGYY